ncbi:GNAT family N-acetyltransferase [Egicoccus sp. AB-alg2]|uniref:GNAT family N-acetyltransferase n=1 Tax=Egicoccus sp. AB-alg2 TaxID=3242693 RepID=UPI00359CD5B4
MTVRVRAASLDDLADVRDVCIRTGADGEDATGTLADDGILPDVYAEPYLRLAPHFAFVADDRGRGRAVGYVLGTADTDAFVAEWRERWLPTAAARHPAPVARPGSRYEVLVHQLHHPEVMRTPWTDAYPAHLHVDLLPEAQGQGLGRALVERFCAEVAAAGAPGVHLGVAASNLGAQAFYRRLGFMPLETTGEAVWFGRSW